jgi:hypothetical protein
MIVSRIPVLMASQTNIPVFIRLPGVLGIMYLMAQQCREDRVLSRSRQYDGVVMACMPNGSAYHLLRITGGLWTNSSGIFVSPP